MNPPAAERHLAAILSSDVVGYSRLMAADEEDTLAALTACRKLMAERIGEHRGRVVDAPGDALLAEFPSALDAVQAAVEIQKALAARDGEVSEHRRMRLRIGVNLGDVLAENEQIFGDGVNIAARLQALCDPGGVCVSGPVHDQVEAKLDLPFEDAGEKEVKNFPKPVHVWRIQLASEDGAADTAPAGEVPGFGGRAAIAVLPFDNLSGDPEQEFFADGIAEDLLTRLALWRHFPVIARNSSFVYKGRAVDVKQVSRELGCRYLVEGSVRKAGNRVRITAQLIDAGTGHHVWAERYDRSLDDVFAVQDEISEAIAAAMHPELAQFEGQRAVRRDPDKLDAWECACRGWWHWNQFSSEHNGDALELFERATALDPDLAWAWAGLSLSHYGEAFFGDADWSESRVADVVRFAERGVALDPRDPWCQFALATAESVRGDLDRMVATMQFAVELNPSLAAGHNFLGQVLIIADRAEEGRRAIEKAMRLSPRDPQMFDFEMGRGMAHYVQGSYEEAATWARRAVQRRSDYGPAHSVLACALGQLGRTDEAAEALSQLLALRGGFSKANFDMTMAAAAPRVREHLLDGLRKAGFED